jgi:RNA polymerase sigma-70 factor (ECF subfamily)
MRFEELYDRAAEDLLVYFTRRTLDPDTALDLWAETLASAFAGWRRFRGSSADQAVAWLYGIARNQWASYLRRGYAERRAMRRLGLERPELQGDDLERLSELAELPALRGRVDAALAHLPAGQRDAIRLRVVDELPYDQVAGQLAVSETAARARVSRGLRRLEKLLSEPT